MSAKKTKREKKRQVTEQEAPPPVNGFVGYLIGGVLGVIILASLYWMTAESKPGQRTEIPQLTVLAEFDDLSDEETRKDLIRLHEELLEAGVIVMGPKNYPLLVPNERKIPLAKDLDELSVDEFEAAKPYMGVEGWLVPRVYSPNLKSAIFRCYPDKRKRFLSGTRKKIEDVLKGFEGSSLTLLPYSKELGLDDKDAWTKTNVVFGVQSANVQCLAPDKDLDTIGKVQELTAMATALEHERIRSMVGPSSFYEYAKAVWIGKPEDDLGITVGEYEALKDLAKRANIPPQLTKDGDGALLIIGTDAEGQENIDLCYWIAGNAKMAGIRFVVRR